MSQTKAQLLDNIKDNVQLDARNSLRFADTDSSHYVAFKAPATVSSNVTWTLPAADGSANYVLATDGSGTLSWIADPAGQWTTSGSNIYFTGGNVGIGDSSPSNPLSVTGASAFNGDVTLTGASYNAVWDKSDNALEFADSAKASFGAGVDLSIYHTDPNGFIKYQNENGHLRILSGVSGNGGIQLKNRTDDATYLTCISEGAVELYFNNSKKFATTSYGSAHTGIMRFENSGDGISLYDSRELKLGSGDDLKLYHSGSNNIIRCDNGYQLHINKDTSENMAKFIPDGAVELFHNNVRTFHTTSSGIIVQGAEGGDGNIYLYADEGDDDADQWLMQSHASGGWYLKSAPDGAWETNIKAVGNGGVELYYNNVKKIETATDKILFHAHAKVNADATYDLGASGARWNDLYIANNIYLKDNGEIRLGADGDLQVFHNSSSGEGRIYNSNAAGLVLISNLIKLKNQANNENMLQATADGAVELYYDGAKVLYTNTNGVTVHAAEGGDANLYLHADEGDDDADKWLIQSESDGYFALKNNASGSYETSIKATGNGAVELYYDNSLKFQTTSYGCLLGQTSSSSAVAAPPRLSLGSDYHDAAGTDAKLSIWESTDSVDHMGFGVSNNQLDVILTSDSFDFVVYGGASGATERFRMYGDGTGIKLPDSSNAVFGTGDDLLIYHDGTDTYFKNHTTGSVYHRARTNWSVAVNATDGGADDAIKCLQNGAVELYYDHAIKFKTTTDGIKIGDDTTGNPVINAYGGLVLKGTGSSWNTRCTTTSSSSGSSVFEVKDHDDAHIFACVQDSYVGVNGTYKFYIGANWNDDYTASDGIRFMNFHSTGYWMTNTFNSNVGGNTPGPYMYNRNASNNGTRFYVKVDGGVVNHSGNNSNLCDERMKKNIVDAPSYWNSIKNIGIKKFNYKTEPAGTPLKVGVIAQQVEAIESDLVDDDFAVDGPPNDESSTKYKSVHEEQLFMMGIKALQEAMAKIETLETKVAALESA